VNTAILSGLAGNRDQYVAVIMKRLE